MPCSERASDRSLLRGLVMLTVILLTLGLSAAPAHGQSLRGAVAQRRSQRLALLHRATVAQTPVPPSTATRQFSEEEARIRAVEQATDAVVSVIISKHLPVLQQSFEDIDLGNGIHLRVPTMQQGGTSQQVVGAGSAFFVSADGYLLTNEHVVSDLDAQYTVLLNSGNSMNARVIARDPVHDIALLHVARSGTAFLTLANRNDIHLAQTAIAIGNTLGKFHNTVSVGVISSLHRNIQASASNGKVEQLTSVLQTDAAINAGNSGGPLVNLQGRVIGMNTAHANGAENVGFAIPADTLRSFLEDNLPG
ncbi:trypsin-like peptidase domain-containing protein [Candidatus Peregrinibacteria bacterium]|nr:trypsin-like peptidase domain-containing protein [Candidatus Peregrinibacteria bacterium]